MLKMAVLSAAFCQPLPRAAEEYPSGSKKNVIVRLYRPSCGYLRSFWELQ